MAEDEKWPIEIYAYHEAGHALAAFMEGVSMDDIYLFEDNGTVGYTNAESLPDALRVNLGAAGDAAVAVLDGSGDGAPLRMREKGDFDSNRDRIRRILQESDRDGTDDEMLAYFKACRDAWIERFATLSSQRALKAFADELLSQPIEYVVPELKWRHLSGFRAPMIFRKALGDG